MNFPNVYTINFPRKIQGEKNISDYNKDMSLYIDQDILRYK